MKNNDNIKMIKYKTAVNKSVAGWLAWGFGFVIAVVRCSVNKIQFEFN